MKETTKFISLKLKSKKTVRAGDILTKKGWWIFKRFELATAGDINIYIAAWGGKTNGDIIKAFKAD